MDGVEIRAGCNGIALVVAGVPVGGLRSAGHRAVQEGADERAFCIVYAKLNVIAHGQLEIQRNGTRRVPAQHERIGIRLIQIQSVRAIMKFHLIAVFRRSALIDLVDAVKIGSGNGAVVGTRIILRSLGRAHATHAVDAREAVAIHGALDEKHRALWFILNAPREHGSGRRSRG